MGEAARLVVTLAGRTPATQRPERSLAGRARSAEYRTRVVVLVRALQLLLSMIVAGLALYLVTGIFRPDASRLVKIELATVIIVSFTAVVLAISAATRLHRDGWHTRHRCRLPGTGGMGMI